MTETDLGQRCPHGMPKGERCPECLKSNPTPLEEAIPGIDTSNFSTVKANTQRDLDANRPEGRGRHHEHVNTRVGTALITDTPFARHEYNFLCKDVKRREKLQKIFAGQIIVDLGAGDGDGGYRMAQVLNAKSYVGVEPHHSEELEKALSETGLYSSTIIPGYEERFQIEQNKIPFSIAPVDILTLLKSLPDHSVSVLASGIDHCITSSFPPWYLSQVSIEIKRVLHPTGGLLLIYSDSGFGKMLRDAPDYDNVRTTSSHNPDPLVYTLAEQAEWEKQKTPAEIRDEENRLSVENYNKYKQIENMLDKLEEYVKKHPLHSVLYRFFSNEVHGSVVFRKGEMEVEGIMSNKMDIFRKLAYPETTAKLIQIEEKINLLKARIDEMIVLETKKTN